jgi:alkaline phosphatase
MRNILITTLVILILTTGKSYASNNNPADKRSRPAKNIILMIGDGMGTAHIYAGYTANKGKLNLERFPVCGFSITWCTNNYVTDSGAGGTAIATGHKTNYGAIGVDSAGQPVKSILEWADQEGKATGLVTTCAITHATPASFIAHQATRSDYEPIALDFLDTPIDLFIGGGRDHFEKRADSMNLSSELIIRGYRVAYNLEDIRNTLTGPLAGLLAPVHQPKWSEGRGDQLPESVKESLRLLSEDKDGFFLMVEGSQIDWAGHDNDIKYLIEEVLDFDKAIGIALDFAQQNGETLVIVIADHETGGLTIPGGNLSTGEVTATFSTKEHTGVMVPVFSYGPHASAFGGIQQNTDIFRKMIKAFGFAETF